MSGDSITLDVSGWPRLPEVREYARRRGVTFADALHELVNAGLSHYPGDLLLPRDEELSCRHCGDSYAGDGDGFDGFCPSCSDRLEDAGFWEDGDSERDDPADYIGSADGSVNRGN